MRANTHKGIAVWALAALLMAVLAVGVGPTRAQSPDAGERQVRAAVDQWIVVLNAMLNGDPTQLSQIYAKTDDAMYMGAEGTYRIGWDAIYADWTAQAKKSSGGTVKAVDVHVVVSGPMAMASHITAGKVRQPDGKMNDTFVRETSVFRQDDGVWRMIGHHADAIPYWERAFGETTE